MKAGLVLFFGLIVLGFGFGVGIWAYTSRPDLKSPGRNVPKIEDDPGMQRRDKAIDECRLKGNVPMMGFGFQVICIKGECVDFTVRPWGTTGPVLIPLKDE